MKRIKISDKGWAVGGGVDAYTVPESVKLKQANGDFGVLKPGETVSVPDEVAETLKQEMGWRLDVLN